MATLSKYQTTLIDAIEQDLTYIDRVGADINFINAHCAIVNTAVIGQCNFSLAGVNISNYGGNAEIQLNPTNNQIEVTQPGLLYNITLDNGLYFPLAEGSGSVSYDKVFNPSLRFTDNSYGLLDNVPNIISNQPGFTISITCKKDQATTDALEPFFTYKDPTGTSYITLYALQDKGVMLRAYDNHTMYTILNEEWDATEESTYVCTFDFVAERMSLFINGSIVGATDIPLVNPITASTLSIGAYFGNTNFNSFYLHGRVFKVIIDYTVQLNPNNITGEVFTIDQGSGTTTPSANNFITWYNATWTGGETITWNYPILSSVTQDEYHHNLNEGFTLSGGIKLPYKVNGAYTNPPINGHNGAESLMYMPVYRSNLGHVNLYYPPPSFNPNIFTDTQVSDPFIDYDSVGGVANLIAYSEDGAGTSKKRLKLRERGFSWFRDY